MKTNTHTGALREIISDNYAMIPPSLMTPLSGIVEEEEGAVDALATYVFANEETLTRGMRRFAGQLVTTPAILPLIILARVLHKAKFNTDKLIQLPTLCSAIPPLEETLALRVKDIALLRRYYNDDRIFKLLTGPKMQALRDTTDMMEHIIQRKPDMAYLPKKPKTLTQLHDCAVRALPKLNQDDFPLNQREDIVVLDGKPFDDTLTIKVPKTHYDMIDLGEALSFCIGNGSYSRNVANRKSSVIALFEGGQPRYGIQFSRYRILEAQGFGNQRRNRPTPEMLKALQGILLKAPDLPSDFLPITDSGWVHGYRYDNKNLYLLLRDKIYIYADVPEDVYEELLDSERKGTFVNQVIKPGYECEFLGMAGEEMLAQVEQAREG